MNDIQLYGGFRSSQFRCPSTVLSFSPNQVGVCTCITGLRAATDREAKLLRLRQPHPPVTPQSSGDDSRGRTTLRFEPILNNSQRRDPIISPHRMR